LNSFFTNREIKMMKLQDEINDLLKMKDVV